MGHSYKERREEAKEDIAKWCDKHVMVEEPVRSFRFHGHNVDKRYDKGRVDHRPGFITFTPVQGAKFIYTSTYCFTLTWTPGHMTIVGDLGQLTVVHHQAMPTLGAACNWLQSPDYDYLLSKTGIRRVFDRDLTVDDLWHRLTEYVPEHLVEMEKEIKAYEADKPKWRKRDGMTKAEFEQEMRYYEEDHPRLQYGFRPCKQPERLNKNLWRLDERIGWHVPDNWELIAKVWKFFREDYSPYVDEDPNTLLTEEGRTELRNAIDSHVRELSDEEVGAWIYREIEMDDYSGVYQYPEQAFVQIAAIQHGARMILDRHFAGGEKAAAA